MNADRMRDILGRVRSLIKAYVPTDSQYRAEIEAELTELETTNTADLVSHEGLIDAIFARCLAGDVLERLTADALAEELKMRGRIRLPAVVVEAGNIRENGELKGALTVHVKAGWLVKPETNVIIEVSE